MSRIEINADGRHVIVDHTGDLPYLTEKALNLWRATEKPRPVRGFAPEGGARSPRHPGHGPQRSHTDTRCTPTLCLCGPDVERIERQAHRIGCAMLHEPNEPCRP